MTPEKLEMLKKIQHLFPEWNLGDRGYSKVFQEIIFVTDKAKYKDERTLLFANETSYWGTNPKDVLHYPYLHPKTCFYNILIITLKRIE